MKRDLHADLALCEAATNGPWTHSRFAAGYVMTDDDKCTIVASVVEYNEDGSIHKKFAGEECLANRTLIAESREGWPEAIRRAIAAEAEVERLSAFIQSESECAIDTIAENERLRAVLAQIATYGGIDMRGSTCAQTAKDALGSSPPIYDDETEAHRWLKALVSALDDGRIQQTRLSSGTDYVIQGAREWVRKLDSEVTADVEV